MVYICFSFSTCELVYLSLLMWFVWVELSWGEIDCILILFWSHLFELAFIYISLIYQNKNWSSICSFFLFCNETERVQQQKYVIMLLYTFSNGCLGSHNDEERSEMRYVMRIAESSESSKFWTHLALPGNREHVCWSACSQPQPSKCSWCVCFVFSCTCVVEVHYIEMIILLNILLNSKSVHVCVYSFFWMSCVI